jgi:hypothetical protein
MQKIPGIGNEPNDGAEHGCDQDGARIFIDLVHRLTMRGAEGAIKSQLIQNGRRAPCGKSEDNLF